MGGGRKHYFVISFIWECFNCLLWGLVGWSRKSHSYFRSCCYSRKWGCGVSPTAIPSLFQEPSTITKILDEIFKVNANEDIEDMDLCYFTQDTSSTPAPTLFVYSFRPPSSKQKQPRKEESNSKTIIARSTNLRPTTSQPTTTAPSTVTLKRKGSLQITKSSN